MPAAPAASIGCVPSAMASALAVYMLVQSFGLPGCTDWATTTENSLDSRV